MGESKVSMKLLINSQTKKVLFAEAGKDCVDFLFHILSLPLSSVIRLLKKQEMVGSLGNLYESIENLNETYIQPNQNKDSILNTKISSGISSVHLKFIDYHQPTTQKLFYKCNNTYNCHSSAYSDDKRAVCTSCSSSLTTTMTYVAPRGVLPPQTSTNDEKGFVKGVVTYMVMDDLVVQPMSTISSLTLLNKFNVKDVGALQEKVVDITMNEAVKLLKTSLMSKKVLTDVFLNKVEKTGVKSGS